MGATSLRHAFQRKPHRLARDGVLVDHQRLLRLVGVGQILHERVDPRRLQIPELELAC